MGKMATHWHPSWWKEEVHGTAWDLVREAMRRDWQQTKHDLGVGGLDLHQSVGDTLKQAGGAAQIQNLDGANAPLSLGEWHDVEGPFGYGFAARREFGARHPQWDPQLEAILKSEWTAAQDQARLDWKAIVDLVRRGYEFKDAPNAPAPAVQHA